MIMLTRLTGTAFALNPDLIQRADCTPDTVVTLVDGTRFMVRESIAQVIERIAGFRASIIALASHLEAGQLMTSRHVLLAVADSDVDDGVVEDLDGADVIPLVRGGG